jgi:hypothetical protein
MPIYLMSIRVLLSVELCVTLKTYLKGAPFYNAWEKCLADSFFPQPASPPNRLFNNPVDAVSTVPLRRRVGTIVRRCHASR